MRTLLSIGAACAVALASGAAVADTPSRVLKDGRIGYASTDLWWALYQTEDGKAECPDGFNDYGPREVFATLFPDGGTEAETHLVREALKFYPGDTQDKFPYMEAKGSIAIGLNLDGKVGARDFISPDGEKGIDNELYRVIGCSRNYRGPEGQLQLFANRNIRAHIYNRSMIEITDVESLENDPSVTVTIYRGLDRLMTDASGDNIMPGGTQRVDARFGRKFIQELKGRITNGVLETEPKDIYWPWTIFSGTPGEHYIRGMRLRLAVGEKAAEGLMGGYADVETYYRTLTHWSSHHLAYGQLDPSGFYRMMTRLADGYPDANGRNTAISSAIRMRMTQVFIEHPDPKVAGVNPSAPQRTTVQAAER